MVKFTKDCSYSFDGVNIVSYKTGDIVEISNNEMSQFKGKYKKPTLKELEKITGSIQEKAE